MKRKIGRLLALFLALVMVFALVSCGDSTTEEAQEEEPVAEELEEEEAEPEPEIEEEPEPEPEAEPEIEEEAEPEPEIEEEPEPEEEEVEAIVIGLGDSIETDKFTMRFDSVEFYDDGTIWISENSKMSTYMPEGCKRIALKTHFESFTSSPITSPSLTFKVSLLINGEYTYDSSSTGLLYSGLTLDPLEESDIYIYADVPEKAIDILETAEFTIAFNDDLSNIIPTIIDGVETMEADNFYTVVLNFD